MASATPPAGEVHGPGGSFTRRPDGSPRPFARGGDYRWILWFWLVCAAALTGYWALVRLSSLIAMIVVSFFLAAIFEPPVNWMQRKGIKRGIGTVLCFLLTLAVLVGLVVSMSKVLITELADFAAQAPSMAESAIEWVNETTGSELSAEALSQELAEPGGAFQSVIDDVAKAIAGLLMASVSAILSLFTVLLFTYYLVAQGPSFRRSVCGVLPPETQRQVLESWELIIDKTSRYIGARVVLGAICAVFTFVALKVIGVDYALALAVFVGVVSQFVPTVGTYIAGAVPVLVAFAEDPAKGVAVLVFILVYQQVENLVWEPRVNAKAMEMNPAVAFGMVIAGAALFGGLGAVMALPVAAVLMASASTYLERYEVVATDLTAEPELGATPTQRLSRAGRHFLWSIAPDSVKESAARRRAAGEQASADDATVDDAPAAGGGDPPAG
jgi:predicted PurR-regulated permease PerM